MKCLSQLWLIFYCVVIFIVELYVNNLSEAVIWMKEGRTSSSVSLALWMWWNKVVKLGSNHAVRHYSRRFKEVQPPRVIRVTNNIAHLGCPREGPKPRQLLSLPPFPGHPLPGKNSSSTGHVTAISWLKYYFNDIPGDIIQTHFKKGLVSINALALFSYFFIFLIFHLIPLLSFVYLAGADGMPWFIKRRNTDKIHEKGTDVRMSYFGCLDLSYSFQLFLCLCSCNLILLFTDYSQRGHGVRSKSVCTCFCCWGENFQEVWCHSKWNSIPECRWDRVFAKTCKIQGMIIRFSNNLFIHCRVS